ncbi:MAG: fumarate hydratase C-terminal domain-containing protein [Armatimonadota bacterium]
MNDTTRNLQVPLSECEVRDLRLGDVVTISGRVFTGRSLFHIRAVEENILPPINFDELNCFFHVGPVMRETEPGWEVVSIEPTSSIRFERYGGPVVRKLGLRALIGKTTMGPGTAEALRDVGGVHLTKIGICGNLLRQHVIRVVDVFFLEELGKTEATWVFEVEHFGLFFVDIDARGNNYFRDLDKRTRQRLRDVYDELGIPQDFTYTEVNP